MRAWIAVAVMTLLVACTQPEVKLEDFPPEEIYARAQMFLDEGNTTEAARYFSEVERLYPYSAWAKRAMIMSAFAYYGDADYERSRSSARRFIEFFPSDQDTAYARYLIALGYYDQIVDVGRDQDNTVNALSALREVIELHPDTDFARDAELKFDFALNHLAGKEMEIGRYYLKRGHYFAAINRFKAVVVDYETSSHSEEALHRMVEAYMALGLDGEARRAAALLGHNFPGSEWYEDTFALIQSDGRNNASPDGTWAGGVWRQVFQGRWL
jgi:outer membrane protein assembly factor BamD